MDAFITEDRMVRDLVAYIMTLNPSRMPQGKNGDWLRLSVASYWRGDRVA